MSSPSVPVNPYHFGREIRNPADFYGREQQLRDILEHVYKRECVSIVGERRSGKTSLLLNMLNPQVRVRYIPHDPNSIFVHIDAEITPQEPEGFFRDVFREVKVQRPDLPISPEEGMDERGVRAAFRAMRPCRLVLFVDEFEWISQCDRFPTRFFGFLRGLIPRFDISYVLATHRSLFESCPHDVATSPFPNLFRRVEMGPFTCDEFERFIEQTSQISGAPMAEVKDDIASMAGYLPYLAQIAGWHYFRAWKEKGQLGSETKALVRRRFEDDARAHFDAVWNRYLGDAERAALQELTEGKRNQKQYILRPLEKKGYVADGRVASEAFTEYIRRQAPEQQAKVPPEPEAPSTGLWVDTASGYVYRDGKPIQPPLTDKEYRLVELLYQSRGKICTPYMIVEAVWGEDYIEDVDDSRIAALTYRLRKKVEPEGRPWTIIITVHGRGLTLGNQNNGTYKMM